MCDAESPRVTASIRAENFTIRNNQDLSLGQLSFARNFPGRHKSTRCLLAMSILLRCPFTLEYVP
jgi:hypothetical protein